MGMINYSEYREEAIKWLKGKRDFEKGVSIMLKTGFRPQVMKILQRKGMKSPYAQERLVKHVRDYISAWSSRITQEDTDESIGVINGVERSPEAENESEPSSILKDYSKVDSFPEEIGNVIRSFRDAYVQKDKLQKQLADCGESNDDETVEKRKGISDAIEKQNEVMEKLYPIYTRYVETGEVTQPEDEEPVVQRRKDIERDANDISSMGKSDLQKLRKSLATKIIRARNMLLYGQETKAEVENPLPEDDLRRVKYESKIKRLEKRVQEIDKEIATKA